MSITIIKLKFMKIVLGYIKESQIYSSLGNQSSELIKEIDEKLEELQNE